MATSFTHQVGGHASTILSSPLSSSTLIKPASSTELDFYQSLGPSLDPSGGFMSEWCPTFYGTLTLQHASDTPGREGGQLNDQHVEIPSQMLVLENLTHKFRKPNILDVKLGRILYDRRSASRDKVEKMKRAAEATTSGELGLRLTGFQVWDQDRGEYCQTPKPFGRTLSSSELDLGLSRFFYPNYTSFSRAELESTPSLPSNSTSSTLSTTSKGGGEIPIPPESFPRSLPPDLLLPILRTLIRRLNSLVSDHLNRTELKGLRMVGTSLLILIEGDEKVLEKSLLRAISSTSTINSSRQEEEEGEGEGGEEEEEEEEEDMDEEGNAKEESLIPFEIKLIDFAHTTLNREEEEEGEEEEDGCREGVIAGIENLKGGLERLVQRLEADERKEEEEERP